MSSIQDIPWKGTISWLASICAIPALLISIIQQVRDKNRRHKEKILSQAQKVACWVSDIGPNSSITVTIKNSSDLPIYKAVISVLKSSGAGHRSSLELAAWLQRLSADEKIREGADRKVFDTIPPGTWNFNLQWTGFGMSSRPGTEICFRDCNSNNWIRELGGNLKRIKNDPFTALSIPQPFVFEVLRPQDTP